MEIYLVRHGIAEDMAESGCDSDRRLTEEGAQKTERVAKAFVKRVPLIDLILHSPYKRARETAEIFATQFPKAKLEEGKGMTPFDKAGFALPQISALSQGTKIMLVGHEPHLSCLASLLITGSDRPVMEFKKAGIAGIGCVNDLQSCYLMFLLTPKMLL
jgi:phosphohistidine phosphatase